MGKDWKNIELEIIERMRKDASRLELRASELRKNADEYEQSWVKRNGPIPSDDKRHSILSDPLPDGFYKAPFFAPLYCKPTRPQGQGD